MGLGKTVQLLAVVCDYIENTKNKKPTLVVCPSSLALNWQNEIEKFIMSENAQHHYFHYVSDFDAHIRQALQAQSKQVRA